MQNNIQLYDLINPNTFKYDLLSNSQAGINYPGQHIGAFVAQDWPPGVVNQEDQAYVPEAASQDGNGEITIKAEKHGDGSITSARLESYQVHSKILTQSRSYIIGCKIIESTELVKLF